MVILTRLDLSPLQIHLRGHPAGHPAVAGVHDRGPGAAGQRLHPHHRLEQLHLQAGVQADAQHAAARHRGPAGKKPLPLAAVGPELTERRASPGSTISGKLVNPSNIFPVLSHRLRSLLPNRAFFVEFKNAAGCVDRCWEERFCRPSSTRPDTPAGPSLGL